MVVDKNTLNSLFCGTLMISLISLVILNTSTVDSYYVLDPKSEKLTLLNQIDASFSGMDFFVTNNQQYLIFLNSVTSNHSFTYSLIKGPDFHKKDMTTVKFSTNLNITKTSGLSTFELNHTMWYTTIITTDNHRQQILLFNNNHQDTTIDLAHNLGKVKNLYTNNGNDFVLLTHRNGFDDIIYLSNEHITKQLTLPCTYNAFIPTHGGYYLANADNRVDLTDFNGVLLQAYLLNFEPSDIDLLDGEVLILDNQ